MKKRNILLHLLLVAMVALTFDLQVDRAQAASLNATSRPPDLSAKASLPGMYVPFENWESWSSLVCSGMTQGGCNYFMAHEARAAWQIQKDMDITGASLEFQDSVASFENGMELWRLKLNVFTSEETQSYDVYATVLQVDGTWLLDRIVIAPGISPE